ncbi:MAG: FAD:protein FMN transferase [Nitrospirae bacterium]|jgi:thiamine biosynthesis lipoprotein|nr:FAD:protein FMN transferase [Nitrospirota bacterium]
MNTIVSITAVSESKDKAEKAIKAAFDEINKIQKLTDFYSGKSEISLINKNAGVSPVKVSGTVIEILEKALDVSEKTKGSFDITIGAISSLYDFSKNIKPSNKEILKRLKYVNYKNIIIDRKNQTVFLKKKGMLIDTGGITKGYASDKAAEVLKINGIKSGIIAVGGEIHAFGTNPDNKLWKIGIKDPDPNSEENDIIAAIELSDSSISTSGDYQRFFILDGKKYHHILDPKTGMPADLCRSVTVIGKENSMTDALATGIFVLGPEEGIKILKENGLNGVIIDKKNNLIITPELDKKIEFTSNCSKYNKS